MQIFWQGWKESNLRMPESKSGALTNLATPLHGAIACHFIDQQPTHNQLQTDAATNPQGDGFASYCIYELSNHLDELEYSHHAVTAQTLHFLSQSFDL